MTDAELRALENRVLTGDREALVLLKREWLRSGSPKPPKPRRREGLMPRKALCRMLLRERETLALDSPAGFSLNIHRHPTNLSPSDDMEVTVYTRRVRPQPRGNWSPGGVMNDAPEEPELFDAVDF